MAIQFLDLWDKLVNEVAGSPVIFLVMLILGILFISAYYKFTGRVTLMLITASVLIVSYFINKLLAVVLFIVLVFIGIAYSRAISRG